ncbi:MAG: hypothetical protein PVI68_02965 [Anaerolineae bacterium]|jgi:membrane-associated HD superfamily phosphohydrolase
MSKASTTQTPDKERGGWLTAWLILILLHGIIASILIFYLRQQQSESSPAWVLALLFLLSIADIVAAIAMWYWKKWGLILYLFSTVVGIAIGLILTRSQLIVFHDIVPLAILGYLVRDKLDWFD